MHKLPLPVLILVFVMLLALIWLPQFVGPVLGLEEDAFPVSSATQTQVSILASIGAALFFGLVLWLRRNRKR